MDVGAYLSAVWRSWFALVGIISTSVWIVEVTTGWRLPKLRPATWLVIGVVCFSIAQYQAWEAERTEALSLQAENKVLRGAEDDRVARQRLAEELISLHAAVAPMLEKAFTTVT